MAGTSRCTLGSQSHHIHSLEDHTRFIRQRTSTHCQYLHNINNNITTTPKQIASCFTKQFKNTVNHATHMANRYINRTTQKIQGYNITLITTQVQEAKQSKNKNSNGPDKQNIRHLKHKGPLRIAFLTSNCSNTNIILQFNG